MGPGDRSVLLYRIATLPEYWEFFFLSLSLSLSKFLLLLAMPNFRT